VIASDLDWLRLLADGRTVAEIATTMGYSHRAVHRQLKQMYDRLGVDGKISAIVKAARAGLLDGP
jgi:DNA-binding NarL/FixJ family response regulator